MAPGKLEGMDTTNKRVATSCQWQQCDLMGAGYKIGCFVVDLFKNTISQLEKEISKKDEIISFLTEQLSVKNAFTIPLQIPREEAHTTKLNKKKKLL